MTVVVPRPQVINGVGHCSYVSETGLVCNCAEEREDPFVQLSSELVNARRCATTGAAVLTVQFCGGAAIAGHRHCRHPAVAVQTALVEMPQMQPIDGRRYPCCGVEAVWGNCAKTVDVHRLRF